MRSVRHRIALGVLIAGAACSDDSGTEPTGPSGCVPLTALGTLGGDESWATGINERGQVVGTSTTGSGLRAFLWDGGVMTALGTFGGSSWGTAINDSGWVVGFSYPAQGGNEHAFLWRNGVMTDLGTLGGSTSRANGINSAGWVVGSSHLPGDTIRHAFLWRDGVMIDLSAPGDRDSEALAINSAGQIVGWRQLPGIDPATRAFVWQNGMMTELGTLGGLSSEATDINEAGRIVGSSSTLDGSGSRAFVWENGVMTELGVSLPSFAHEAVVPRAIDSNGRVVGYLEWINTGRAFVWEDGVVTDLGGLEDLAEEVTWAHDINSAGLAVGYYGGADADDLVGAILWDVSCLSP
ncbi:MAG TPA: hypothetical protein VLE53_12920 [Gemmatimonadaceae bacterium]|nr:hypothetical protein [Gemmatimonadaceae bacterium]